MSDDIKYEAWQLPKCRGEAKHNFYGLIGKLVLSVWPIGAFHFDGLFYKIYGSHWS